MSMRWNYRKSQKQKVEIFNSSKELSELKKNLSKVGNEKILASSITIKSNILSSNNNDYDFNDYEGKEYNYKGELIFGKLNDIHRSSKTTYFLNRRKGTQIIVTSCDSGHLFSVGNNI